MLEETLGQGTLHEVKEVMSPFLVYHIYKLLLSGKSTTQLIHYFFDIPYSSSESEAIALFYNPQTY